MCARSWGVRGVVDGNTARWAVLSDKTSTPVPARVTIDESAVKARPTIKLAERRSIMMSVLGQQLWKAKLVSGVLTIVLGAMILAWPGPSILVASTMFGVYLLVSGFTELFLAFTLPRSAATRVLLFLTGALSIVLAILSFRHFGDIYAVLLLALWIGIGFIMVGVSESAVAMGERDLPGRGWYVVLGLMSVIAGGVTLVWPFDSILVLAVVSGVSLAILGVIQVVQAFQIRSDTKAAHEAFQALSHQVAAR
jgi:uncharacterized membrane protein HdeD (DUF308 family)